MSDLVRIVAGVDQSIEALLAGGPAGMSHRQRIDQLAGLDRLAARVAARTQRGVGRDPHRSAGDAARHPAAGTRLHEFIVTRDRTCRFPGCYRACTRCEIDHITPFNGTNTTHSNLHCLCPRHHHLKHEAGWTITRTATGTTQWTTPTGHRYHKPPDDYPAPPTRRPAPPPMK